MFTKAINPAYETIGKRQRLTGFVGILTDESGIVLHSMEYSTYSTAERALDALSYELLTDLAERGLVDAVPVACSTCGDDGPDCETPLLTDIAAVLAMALGNAPARHVIPELRRVQARLVAAQQERSMARG